MLLMLLLPASSTFAGHLETRLYVRSIALWDHQTAGIVDVAEKQLGAAGQSELAGARGRDVVQLADQFTAAVQHPGGVCTQYEQIRHGLGVEHPRLKPERAGIRARARLRGRQVAEAIRNVQNELVVVQVEHVNTWHLVELTRRPYR
jgi:hypothetical protein